MKKQEQSTTEKNEEKEKKVQRAPDWLIDLIIETVEVCRKEGKEEILKYTRNIKLKEVPCPTCKEDSPIVEYHNGDIKCLICKELLQKKELF